MNNLLKIIKKIKKLKEKHFTKKYREIKSGLGIKMNAMTLGKINEHYEPILKECNKVVSGKFDEKTIKILSKDKDYNIPEKYAKKAEVINLWLEAILLRMEKGYVLATDKEFMKNIFIPMLEEMQRIDNLYAHEEYEKRGLLEVDSNE